MTDQEQVAGMTYAQSGVSYGNMDPFKRACQLAGLKTADNIGRLAGGEFREYKASRGESVYLIEAAKSYFAHVEEGLGTKNLVADAMYILTGKSYYDYIAQDTVAMIVNDMVTLGALPLTTAMHVAVGDSDWFKDVRRSQDLINGWKEACDLAGCTWGGGETPTLKDVVIPGTVVLSGSATGIVKPKERLINSENIESGNAIMLIGSSGIHANGLTLARRIADTLPNGYLTKIGNGQTFGEALLEPTHIYVGLVEECLNRGACISYAVNITGHGWRKLMRSPRPMKYVVEVLPKVQQVFRFIQKKGQIADEEMYGNFNMGAGFALYVRPGSISIVKEIAAQHGLQALHAGYIRDSSKKQVVIRPLGIEFAGETLEVR